MAAARAAARRQAILNSRGDRLAKLTSSSRGEDPGGVYAHDGSSLPSLGSGLKNIVGEESTLPTSPADSSITSTKGGVADAQMPEWNPTQQQELLRALMGNAGANQPSFQVPPSIAGDPSADPSAPPAEDPISALLASLGGGAGNPTPNVAPSRPRTLTQKLIPVLHVLSMLAMLVWFVVWKEPETFELSWLASTVKSEGSEQEAFLGYKLKGFGWRRWARLARGPPTIAGLVVPPLPAFFWAFTTLELALHSLRLFAQQDDYYPPMLLGLVLPYLPPPFPQAILTSLRYLQMGSMVLDDLSILVFGIGLVIFVSNWAT
ncbi:hypothetical protein JB92DRAFT_2952835 [Gautieria morchelliformis]|nr:hypothetical protein JB92DRAFT_2952835 [Gautieria morchelliformis]